MKNLKRTFFKLIGVSFLSTILLPYKFLHAVTKKIINLDLTEKQKDIMLNEATERPYSSPLNHEKRKASFTVQTVGLNFFHQTLNLIVGLVGRLFLNLCLVLLKLPLIIHLG